MQACRSGIAAFRESMLASNPRGRNTSAWGFDDWCTWQARCTRYDLHWAFYENTAYRDVVHPFAARFKTQFGLYKHVRHLYNPAYRLGEFWAGHLMGGILDRDAGDGESAPSALPILTDVAALRPAIARLWGDSRWQVAKETYTRWGAVLGDVALKVVDDTTREQVRLEVVHPGHLRWVDFDPSGNVRGYLLERWEYDPRRLDDLRTARLGQDLDAKRPAVRYQEKAYRDGEDVVFETYLDGEPYAWNGGESAWREPYGFVPLVVVHHEEVGLDWGDNCWHAGSGSRFTEVDDLASMITDHVRKASRAPGMVSGPSRGEKMLRSAGTDRSKQAPETTAADPEPTRTQADLLYFPEGSTFTHMTFDLKVAEACEHIAALNADIEKNFPELLADTANLGGTVTAEAIRQNRQMASSKVQARRVPYDEGLVRAQQMAVAIGGWRGYDGYAGFDLDSFAAGRLEHQVGPRAVFEVDPRDSIEEDAAFWAAAGAAVAAGVPLALYLERNGWSTEELAALKKAQAEQKAQEPEPAPKPGAGPAGAKQDPANAGDVAGED